MKLLPSLEELDLLRKVKEAKGTYLVNGRHPYATIHELESYGLVARDSLGWKTTILGDSIIRENDFWKK